MSARANRLTAVGGVMGLAVALLAGCTPSTPSPTGSASGEEYSAPAIVGDAVSASPLESDPSVVAARAALLSRVLARNAADFSIAPFTAAWSESQRDLISSAFVHQLEDGLDTAVQLGPDVLIPLRISMVGETTQVTFCRAREFWPDADESALPLGTETTVSIVGNDSEPWAVDWTFAGPACDATGAAVGSFEPAPVRDAALTVEDVVLPVE